jgi:hypothetical protein
MKRYIITLPYEVVINDDGRCSRLCPSLIRSPEEKLFPSQCDLFQQELVDRRPCYPCELMRRPCAPEKGAKK